METSSGKLEESNTATTNGNEKEELSSMEQLVAHACAILSRAPNGQMEDKELYKELGTPMELTAKVVEELIRGMRVELVKSGASSSSSSASGSSAAAGPTFFRLLDLPRRKLLSITSKPEYLKVYNLIEQAGSKGIWLKILRLKADMALTLMRRILKLLMSHELIREIKVNKKRYFTLFEYEVVPKVLVDHETGDLDSNLIFTLMRVVNKFISDIGIASAAEVLSYIEEKQVCKFELGADTVQEILDAMVYDGQIERVQDYRKKGRYVSEAYVIGLEADKMSTNGLLDIPCTTCPVAHRCSDKGDITPAKCKYLEAWMW